MSKIKNCLKKNKFIFNIYDFFLYYKWKIIYKINPKWAANKAYRICFNKNINWESPQDLIEKCFWLQFNSDTTLWTLCADKYKIREYVNNKGFESLLVKSYGHWDNVDDIDFDKLPDKFVLKSNNGCGAVIIVQDKSLLEIKKTRSTLKQWLKRSYGYLGAQMHYLRIKPCIIAEELLPNDKPQLSNSIIDYKIWCFNGNPECVLIVCNREDSKMNIMLYDLHWNKLSANLISSSHCVFDDDIDIPRPASFDQMIEACKVLSKPFPEVRMDFYDINGVPYLGEMTFTTGAGYFTDEYYRYLGSKVDLSNSKK